MCSAASCMTPRWLAGAPSDIIRSARYLHVSGISLAISAGACDTVFEAMQLARESGTQVAFDSNLRLKLWPLTRAQACIRQAIALSDIFLPSLEDMVALTGLDDPRALVAAMQGMILALRCPKCQTAMRLVPPKQPEQSRIIRPGAPLNRHERRALSVVGRKHPGQT